MLFLQAPEAVVRLAVVVKADQQLLFSFTGADPAYAPKYWVELTEAEDRVEVALHEEDGHQGFRTLVGHPRWAEARLRTPLGGRPLLLGKDELLPAARAEGLLALPDEWSLLGYEYQRGTGPSWRTTYRTGQSSAMLTQGGAGLLKVDWQRDYFRPLLVEEPDVGGRGALLYTFEGEEGSNHVLAWPTSYGAVTLQVMGPVAPAEVVTLARYAHSTHER